MDVVRWGVIGTGAIARAFADDLKHVSNGVLSAVGSRHTETAQAFAGEFGASRWHGTYDALCADPGVDAVYVATPHNLHLDNARSAFEGGKAVLCEKPLTPTFGEAEAMIAAARSSGRPLMEALWTYFLPALVRARAWVQDGRIGEIRHIKADFGYPMRFDPTSRLYAPELAGGALLDMGIYPIALAWFFLERDPQVVHAVARKAATGVDDDLVMMFDYGDCTATLGTSFRCKLKNAAYVIGTDGFVEIPDFWRAKEAHLYAGDTRVDSFDDRRPSHGLCFETKAFGADILAGRQQSSQMPWSASLALQRHMSRTREASST